MPFNRPLSVQEPALTGTDVTILQNLLLRFAPLSVTNEFDAATGAALSQFQTSVGLPATGLLDGWTARAVMAKLADDNYVDNGRPAKDYGKKYKVFVPVHRNRSIETNAVLFDAEGSALFTFPVRAHGTDSYPVPPWPYFDNNNYGLNMFSSDGDTPTGLIEFDLNSPEPDTREFGPWPINRAVRGIEGNAGFLIPAIRNGILLHTGEWSTVSDWQPPQPMPNSLGCIHAWPQSIETVFDILTQRLNVTVRPNPFGKTPYPYEPQGLLSVQQID